MEMGSFINGLVIQWFALIYLICYNIHNMHIHHLHHELSHPSKVEQDIAVAITLWLMLAGFMIVMANAWAMEMLVE